jgi:hypothetical protein
MANDPADITLDQYNQKVTEWGEHTGDKIRNYIPIGKGKLRKSFRLKTAKMYGEIDKLSYHFIRHGIFIHKGVGRGYHMVGGKVMRGSGKIINDKNADVNVRLRQMVLRSAKVMRQPVEWFNPVIAANITQLADLVTEMDADRVVNGTKILIR